jgi:hypothetical protein
MHLLALKIKADGEPGHSSLWNLGNTSPCSLQKEPAKPMLDSTPDFWLSEL